jgi:methylglutaconyl-CoA hydratase
MSASQTRPDGPLVSIGNDGAVRTLTLNRPQRRNALNDAMLGELVDALRAAQADPQVRVIVLAGAGPCFCSGRDQRDAGAAGAARALLQDGSLQRTVGALTDVLALLVDSPQPTVASVHGVALAAGQALTLACDFVVAERDARFGNPEMRFGFPAAMNTVLLARHLGRRKALEIAITGALYVADEYAALGLVNRLADPGARAAATQAFTTELAALAPWAVRHTKRLLHAVEACGMDASLHAGDALNQVLRANAQIAPVFEDVPGTSERLRRELAQGRKS